VVSRIGFAFLIATLPFALSTSACEPYRMPSTSMEPTILRGDYVLAVPLNAPPTRGEIVIYRTPRGPWVKRIVGTPGDTVSMRHGTLFINGDSVPEPYASHKAERDMSDTSFGWQRHHLVPGHDTTTYRPTLTSWGPLLVPLGDYFLLGDNRGESADSRYTGFVPAASIVERPMFVYFSYDSETRTVRWSRIGTRLKPPT